MSHGVRTIVRTQTGPPGKDGEVTAIQLAAHAAKDRGVHGITVDTTVGTRVMLAGQMVYGDTGWRDVSGLLVNGWVGQVFLRRVGELVVLHLENVSAEAATSGIVLTAPSGLQPGTEGANFARGALMTLSGAVRRAYMAGAGPLTVSGYSSGDRIYDQFRYPAEAQSWPVTLPGTPA